jgi:hypothetical protein
MWRPAVDLHTVISELDQDMAYTKLDAVSNGTQLYRHYAQLELLQIIRFDSGLRLEIFARPEYWAIILESSLKLLRSTVKTVKLNKKDQSSLPKPTGELGIE